MKDYLIAPIVEGHGEVQAIPILLQRILSSVRSDMVLSVNPALRVKAGSFFRDQCYLAKYVELAACKAKGRGAVLILLDSEDQCPAEAGLQLADRATAVRADVPIVVALAHREYETWFLAAARSLRGVSGLPNDLDPPAAPETIRDAKGWLNTRMPSGYNPPNDQPALTSQFSFNEAAAIPSFFRLHRKLGNLFNSCP